MPCSAATCWWPPRLPCAGWRWRRAIVNTAQTITGDFCATLIADAGDATLARLRATLGKTGSRH
jgi:hypothetical protein